MYHKVKTHRNIAIYIGAESAASAVWLGIRRKGIKVHAELLTLLCFLEMRLPETGRRRQKIA